MLVPKPNVRCRDNVLLGREQASVLQLNSRNMKNGGLTWISSFDIHNSKGFAKGCDVAHELVRRGPLPLHGIRMAAS